MSVKNEVLKILETNSNNVSGQELANKLNVSRNAVWKAINSLKDDGYIIESSYKGYSLSSSNDVLSASGIKFFLDEHHKDIPIKVYKTITSTNTLAKEEAINNAPHLTIILAEEQTSGRGRFGRSFFSPPYSGIYLSVILRLNLSFEDSVLVTPAAAVAVCKSIEKLSNKNPKIKWVNDIFLDDKKVCGILTEAVTDMETKTITSIVLGIGVNVKTKKTVLPDDLQNIVGSIYYADERGVTRNQLAAEILNNVIKYCSNLVEKDFMKEYREKSMILGEYITYVKNNELYGAYAHDIDDGGGLIVIDKNNNKITLQSGEVSIRKKP